MRTPLSVIAGLLTAGLLLFLLIDYSELTAAKLIELLKRPSGLALFGIFLASVGHMTCGALKWRAIVTRIAPAQTAQSGHIFYLFYTTLSATLAQFVMVHLASLLVRGLAGRVHHKVPFIHGAAASVFEQLFDVYVLLLFAIAGIIAWSATLSPMGWSAVVLVVVVTGWLALLAALRLLHAYMGTPPRALRFVHTIYSWFASCRRLGLVEPKLVLRLYALSVLRYFFMAVRMAIVVTAVTPAIELFDAIVGFTVVQSSQLLAVTPGNLGITEWTWAGFLGLRGYPTDTATGFSLALRILSYASIVAVLGLMAILFAIERVRHHQPRTPRT